MFFSRLGDTYLRILNTFLSGIRSSCHESEYLKFFTVRFCRMVHGDFLDRSSFTFYRSEDSYRKDFSFDVSHLRLCRCYCSTVRKIIFLPILLPWNPVYCRILSCGIHQWKLPEAVRHVSLGLQRCTVAMSWCHPSGLCATVVYCRTDFGFQTAFIGKIGKDMQGEFLKKSLRKHLEKMIPLVYDCARENFRNYSQYYEFSVPQVNKGGFT